jgi:hypothetical protein
MASLLTRGDEAASQRLIRAAVSDVCPHQMPQNPKVASTLFLWLFMDEQWQCHEATY